MTALLPYLCLGGIEIANPCRLMAYVRRQSAPRPHGSWAVGDYCPECCCADYDDGPYTYPADTTVGVNQPPWMDSAVPESGEFFGVLIRTFTMETPLQRIGATDQTLGRLITRKRTLTFEADLVSSTERGAAYGYQWLVQALVDASQCGVDGCADKAIVYVSCDTVTGKGARRLFGVGLVSITDTTPTDGSFPPNAGRRVRVELEAEIPWLYSIDDISCVVATQWDLNPILSNADCAAVWDSWLTRICQAPGTQAQIVTACGLPPDCAPAQAPIVPPTPLSSCFCEPIYSAVQCCSTPDIPDWSQAVLTFVVESGQAALRNARVVVYENPTNQPCPSEVDPGDPIFSYWGEQVPIANLEIAYIPAQSTLTIDGKIGTITLDCSGQCFDADSFVTGANSTVWIDPVVECVSGSLCACMYVDAANTNPEAKLSIYVTERTMA
jgi:hypothetical protein